MGAAKAFPRRRFMVIHTYLKKQEKFQINNLTLYIKKLEKEQTKSKINKMKEIIKIREETEMGYRLKKIEEMNDTKSCFF